jgi:hypothetical protein
MQSSPACAASLQTDLPSPPNADRSSRDPNDLLYRVMTVAAIFLILSNIWVL